MFFVGRLFLFLLPITANQEEKERKKFKKERKRRKSPLPPWIARVLKRTKLSRAPFNGLRWLLVQLHPRILYEANKK